MSPKRHKWIKPLARGGYSARGLVYTIVGIFAILAALGLGEKKDTKDALSTLLQQPFGTFLVWLLVVGLFGYVLWRLVQSLFDTDEHGHGPKGLAVRGGLLASAFTYSTLAIYALSLLGVLSGGDGNGGGSDSVAGLIGRIVGRREVSLLLSAIFVGVAGAHIWKAVTRKYRDHFEADEKTLVLIDWVSVAGLIARGMVFAVIALLFFYRFLSAGQSEGDNPNIKDAMRFLQDLPFGQVLLIALGVGLIAFSLYSFAEARWRRINVEDA